MKKIYTTLLFAFLSIGFCKAQSSVTIPDANFVMFLQASYPSCMNGDQLDITCSDILNTQTMDCSGLGITDLTGIEYFTGLQTINCSNNQLTTLPVITANLKDLDCSYNLLNNLNNLPVSLLTILCDNNQITYLSPLVNNINLDYLDCHDNLVTSIDTLPNTIEKLYCSYNLLTSISVLPSAITVLDARGNQINYVGALPPYLYQIDLSFNQLTVPFVLPQYNQNLDISGNHLTRLPDLPSSLSYLRCTGNQLSDISVISSSNLLWLDCSYNKITALPSIPDSMQQLTCSNNSITDLSPLVSSNVSILDCSFNSLTTFPFIKTLTQLRCENNLLTQLPSLPPALTWLECNDNKLSTLPELPPVLTYLLVNDNPGLLCMPLLKSFEGGDGGFSIANTGITCLPNVIQHNSSIPAIDTMPICNLFNTNGCGLALNIEGNIFADINGNCLEDSTDKSVNDIKLNLYQGSTLVQSGYFSNNYSFKTGFANYTVKVDTANLPFVVTCPATDSVNVNVTPVDSLHYGIDFGLQCKPGFDVGAWSITRTWNFFPTETAVVQVLAGDPIKGMFGAASCVTGLSGQVKVVIGGPVDYKGPVANALNPVLSNDTLIYTIADFSLVNSGSFAFSVVTQQTAHVGDQVCFDVYVTPTAGDNNLSNNRIQHCFTVDNSFDPNEKEVSPVGTLNYPYTDWLTYTIHFQNTGTAAARHIQVLDTLDANLDPETFQLLAYSFKPTVQITGRNVAFDFVSINLPDSTTNKAGSTGYVEYRVKPVTNLGVGSAISNTASIYFDFNAPVVTNTVTNNVAVLTGVTKAPVNYPVTLYPNPIGDGLLVVSCLLLDKSEISVTDILGRNILTQKATSNKTTINVSNLTAGVYFVHVNASGVNEVRKFVKE